MLVPMTPELGELHRRELLAEAERRRLARALDRDQRQWWAARRTLGGALIRAGCWLARVPAGQTVPQLARRRAVSRQDRQALVNRLRDQGLVELVENPAHRRSPLVRLTPRGKALVDEMTQREPELLAALGIHLPEADLRAAADVLRAIRERLQSPESRRLLERVRAE